jgi:hypothetical protein
MSISLAHKGLPPGVTHFSLADLIEKIEAPRVSWRLLLVRRRSHHEQDDKQVFT